MLYYWLRERKLMIKLNRWLSSLKKNIQIMKMTPESIKKMYKSKNSCSLIYYKLIYHDFDILINIIIN